MKGMKRENDSSRRRVGGTRSASRCLRKVLRCLPSTWSLIVIYNDDRAPVRRDANTLGLMKLADISPRELLSHHLMSEGKRSFRACSSVD